MDGIAHARGRNDLHRYVQHDKGEINENICEIRKKLSFNISNKRAAMKSIVALFLLSGVVCLHYRK